MAEEKNSLIGTEFQDEKSRNYRILEKLEVGGQGITWLVEDTADKKNYVLKLIFEFDKAREDQIRKVMECREKRRKVFNDLERDFNIYCAWPLVIVNSLPGKYRGGYIMDYLPLGNCVNYEYIENDDKTWDYEELCRVSIQLCRGLSGFHNAGYCYKDVSRDNILFDMNTGSLYIIDLDNVSVANGKIAADVWGTSGFMAPEIQRRETYPNEQSDFFSIAVILFYMWGKWNPFDGRAYRLLDLDGYMKNPVFIFHPSDSSNSPDGEDFEWVRYWWDALPKIMQKLFIEAFVDKLESQNRISVTQWITKLQDVQQNHLMKCPNCGKMIAKDAPYCGFCGEEKEISVIRCPKCGKPLESKKSYCSHCHASLIVCDACGELNVKRVDHCAKCGKAFKKSTPTVMARLMEVWEKGTKTKKFSTDEERPLSGADISDRLKKYKEVLRFETYNDNGKERMVMRNMMEYLNWMVTTTDGKSMPLAPGRIAAVDKVKEIILENGVTLVFDDYRVKKE